MTETQPYLINPSHKRWLAPPPRRVSRWTKANRMSGALMFPAIIVGAGIWMVIFSLTNFELTPIRVVGTMMCAGAVLSIAGLILNGTLGGYRHEMRLLRDGRVILGEVTACSMIVSKGTNTAAEGVVTEYTQVTVTIEYAFTTPADVRRTGKVVKEYTEVPKRPRPEVGDAMAMLYLDEEKSMLL